MAIELLIKPANLKLIPVTAGDQEIISNLVHADYLATLKRAQPRSVRQNRFYWKILGLVVENQERWPRAEMLHLWLKDRLGHYKVVLFPDGRQIQIFDSTGFARMDPTEFKKFMDSALDIIVAEIIPGLKRKELVNEVESMLGYSYNSLWIEDREVTC